MAHAATAQTPIKIFSDEQREAFIEVFGKDYSKHFQDPLTFKNISMFSPAVKSEYKQNFKVLSRCLFAEYVYRRRYDYNHALLDKFALICSTKLADIQKLINLNIARVTKMCETEGQQQDSGYLSCLNKTAPIIHASAMQYVRTLELLDQLFQVTGSAALHGVISSDQRREAELKCRKAVRAFATMVRNEAIIIRREGQRVLALSSQGAEGGDPVAADVDLRDAVELQGHAIEESAAEAAVEDAQNPQLALAGSAEDALDGIVANGLAAGKRGSKTAAAASVL